MVGNSKQLAVGSIQKRLSKIIAGFLTYETGWMEVSFIKIGKIEEGKVSSTNSAFSCDRNEFEVLVTYLTI